jgi:dihydroflavonol-4-reductase
MNLITGASGLIGSHLAYQLLKNNEEVVAIKRAQTDIHKTKHVFSYYDSNYEELFAKIKWVEADLLDIYSLIDALDGIKTVYHCAGFVDFDTKNQKKLHQINAEGTANLVNACLEKNIEVLCHVSSIATLQNPDKTENINESVYWKSSPRVSNYAISKYNAEREVWRGGEEGLKIIIVNPGIVLGPGFWNQSSGKLIVTCYKGLRFYSTGSSASIDVRDLASCMKQLVDKKIYNKRFVLIENNYSFQTLLNELHLAFGNSKPNIKTGKLLLQTARFFDWLKCLFTDSERLITRETVNSALDKNSYSNASIKNTLDIQFIPLSETTRYVSQVFLNDLKKQSLNL